MYGKSKGGGGDCDLRSGRRAPQEGRSGGEGCGGVGGELQPLRPYAIVHGGDREPIQTQGECHHLQPWWDGLQCRNHCSRPRSEPPPGWCLLLLLL